MQRFGEHVVVGGGLDPTLGRAFSDAEHVRRVADYGSIPIDMNDARTMLVKMDRLIDMVEAFVAEKQS